MGPGERVHVGRLTGMSFNISCVPWPWVGKGFEHCLSSGGKPCVSCAIQFIKINALRAMLACFCLSKSIPRNNGCSALHLFIFKWCQYFYFYDRVSLTVAGSMAGTRICCVYYNF